jgi:hypothetical protein
MTPPAAAVVVASTDAVPSTAVPSPRSAPGLRAVQVAAPPAWECDNCELPNAARRRRCSDCGTSRD